MAKDKPMSTPAKAKKPEPKIPDRSAMTKEFLADPKNRRSIGIYDE